MVESLMRVGRRMRRVEPSLLVDGCEVLLSWTKRTRATGNGPRKGLLLEGEEFRTLMAVTLMVVSRLVLFLLR